MIDRDFYELLDFGNSRKLERFGGRVVERPCPTASEFEDEDFETESENTVRWDCDLSFEGRTGRGQWSPRRTSSASSHAPKDWQAAFDVSDSSDEPHVIRFELLPTDTGQVGLFPEQAVNWKWIFQKCSARIRNGLPAPKVLNLFAYTGGSTLAAAISGAEVTHVDAAKSVVNWARRNAALSGLAEAPIRWIVEDAPKFVAREIKRGNHYDGIILDPPSYGHGPKREEWKISRDLLDLLSDCKQLLSDSPVCFLLSCHTPGFGAPELSAALSTCLFGSCGAGVQTRPLTLQTQDGRRLPAGHAAYWP